VRVDFDGDTVEYLDDELHGLDLAYALSVRESQGSEYPAIVLVSRRRGVRSSSGCGRSTGPRSHRTASSTGGLEVAPPPLEYSAGYLIIFFLTYLIFSIILDI
jgi:hypothetical protein